MTVLSRARCGRASDMARERKITVVLKPLRVVLLLKDNLVYLD